MKLLDTIRPVDLYLDPTSRDLVLAVKTEIGTITAALTPERACQLGIALIRESGKRYVMDQEPVQSARKEKQHEGESHSDNGQSVAGPISLNNGMGSRCGPEHHGTGDGQGGSSSSGNANSGNT